MLVNKCDRCGSIYDYDYATYYSNEGHNLTLVEKKRTKNEVKITKMDLCPDCFEEVKNFLAKNEPVEKEPVSDA